MNNEEKLKNLLSFLNNYQKLWQTEILNNYPNTYSQQIESWASHISSFSLKDKASLISYYDHKNLPHDHAYFLKEIRELIKIPVYEKNFSLPSTRLVSAKKRHEISKIISFLEKKKRRKHSYDFAGGIGHLTRLLRKHLNTKCTCLDQDKILIQKAQEQTKDPESYLQFSITPNFSFPVKKDSLILALHCCGSLTDHIIDFYKKQKGDYSILSLGCCFHKINRHPLFSSQARTLAAHSHKVTTSNDLEARERVKRFRYSFEFLLKDQFGVSEISTLRSSLPGLYRHEFSKYATYQLERLKIKRKQSDQVLKSFYNNPQRQKEVTRLIHLGYVRLALGRVIELSIALERAIALGPESQVLELFERSISPRNIAIYHSI